MQKPTGFEEVKASGEWTPVQCGGHKMVIKQVVEKETSTGKPMIVVYFDFASDDVQPGYFQKAYSDDDREGKKWPFQGSNYIVTVDNEGKCSKSFKTFTTLVEKSNPGFSIQWVDNFGGQFKGKKIGGVFGVVENEYQGKITKRPQMRWFCENSKAEEANVPEEKLLSGSSSASSAPVGDGFMNIPDGIDEELPFN